MKYCSAAAAACYGRWLRYRLTCLLLTAGIGHATVLLMLEQRCHPACVRVGDGAALREAMGDLRPVTQVRWLLLDLPHDDTPIPRPLKGRHSMLVVTVGDAVGGYER